MALPLGTKEIFHRIVSGASGSISVNFATRVQGFDLEDNFNVYDLNILTGNYRTICDGAHFLRKDVVGPNCMPCWVAKPKSTSNRG